MIPKVIFSFVFFFACLTFSHAQESKRKTKKALKQEQDLLCESVIQHNTPAKKLRKKDYVYSEEQLFRVYNSEKDFATVQLGKRKGRKKPFVYITISSYNACIKQGEAIELLFNDGSSLLLKNKYAVNCEGFIVIELRKKEIQTIVTNASLKSFMIYSFNKDYEFHFTKDQSYQFIQNLICIYNY